MGENLALLRSAIADGLPLVLSTRTASGTCELYVRLVRGAGGDDGIWAELVRGEGELIDRIIHTEMVVRATFNTGPVQAEFETVLHQRRRGLLKADRILLGWPGKVNVTERRKAPREPVFRERPIMASVRRAQGSSGGTFPPVPVVDLSATGATLLYPRGVEPPRFGADELLQLTFSIKGSEYQFAARFRQTQFTRSGARVGVHFEESGCSADAAAWLHAYIEEARALRIRRSLKSAFDQNAA